MFGGDSLSLVLAPLTILGSRNPYLSLCLAYSSYRLHPRIFIMLLTNVNLTLPASPSKILNFEHLSTKDE